MSIFMRALLALFAGVLAVPAFAPVGWFPLAFVSLALLAGLLERAGSKRAGFFLGFAWGLGAFFAGISWLVIALWRYGGMFLPMAVFAIFLFSAFLSLYPALAGAFYVRWRSGGPMRHALLFAGLWVLAEWLRGTLLTGFPWLAIGYSQTPPSPLAGFFPLVGVYGVGGGLAFVAGLLGFCAAGWERGRAIAYLKVPAALAVVIFFGGWAFSRFQWAEPDGALLPVSLVQTNIEQSVKWDSAHRSEILKVNADLVEMAQGELVILPEAALPMVFSVQAKSDFDQLEALSQSDTDYLDMLAGSVGKRNATLAVGVFLREGRQIYNAAATLGRDGGQHYAKRHLVPFGEYSPPLFGWFYRLMTIPMSEQNAGPADQLPLTLAGRQIAANICYEDIFGADLIYSLPRAGLMLNLSNLAWYGDSLAQPQHLQIARARAMEMGRPMLRSTNTGMTALVLPDGSVPAALPAFTRGVLEVEVSAYKGLTPYARWADLPALIVALAGVVIVIGAGWRGRRLREGGLLSRKGGGE